MSNMSNTSYKEVIGGIDIRCNININPKNIFERI